MVRVLAEEADAVVFGPGAPGENVATAYWARVDAALSHLRASVTRRRWWRARVSLASARERRRRARTSPSVRPAPRSRPHPSPAAPTHESRTRTLVDQEVRIP